MLEYDKAEQFLVQHQRHHQPGVIGLLNPHRQVEVTVQGTAGFHLVQIQYPLLAGEPVDERRVGGLGALNVSPVPVAGALIACLAFAHPQRAAGTFEQAGQRLYSAFAHVLAGLAFGKGAGEIEPLFTIVVAVAEKVLGQEHPQAGAQGAGKHQQHQQYDGGKDEYGLHHVAPFAAKQAQVIASTCHQQQVNTGAQKAGGMENHAARQTNRCGPFRVAGGGDRDQGGNHGGDKAACRPYLGIHRIEQGRIGVEIKVVHKQAAQPQAEKLDRPAVLWAGAAVHLLNQYQPHYSQHHQPQIAGPSRQDRLGGSD